MATAFRLPSTVQIAADGSTVIMSPSPPVPMRTQVFHKEAFEKPGDVARQLNTMQTVLHDATLAARTSSRNQSITFEGLIFDGALPHAPIRHGLGTKVRWSVVRWYDTASTAGTFETAQDDQTLTLNSTTAGTADVEVWSAI